MNPNNITVRLFRMKIKDSQRAIEAGHTNEQKAQKREDFLIKTRLEGRSTETALAEIEQEG